MATVELLSSNTEIALSNPDVETKPVILLRKMRTLIRLLLGKPQPLVSRSLLGKEYLVRDGTIHTEPDYDDGWLYACALHSTHVLDVGANIGQAAFIILASTSVESLLMVDPNREALSIAAENLIRNDLVGRVRFLPALASNRVGDRYEFWSFGIAAAGTIYRSMAHSAGRRNAHYIVSSTTIDHLLSQYDLMPDLVKIDVEGAEALVLEGAASCASRRKSRFLVEMHRREECSMVENAARVLDWCERHRYAAWYLADHVRLTDSKMLAYRGRCHILLQPDDWPYPEWLRGIAQKAPLN